MMIKNNSSENESKNIIRNNPKYFISEELWPLYLQIFGILGILVLITIIPSVFEIGEKSLGHILFNIFSNLYPAFTSLFTTLTLIFVFLSKGNYYSKDKLLVKSDEPIVDLDKSKSGKSKKRDIITNSILIVLGFYFLIQFPIGIYAKSNPIFLIWLRILGLLFLIEGAFSIIQIISNRQNNPLMIIFGYLLDVLAVPLLLWLNAHVDIIPILSLRDGKFYLMSDEEITNNILRTILAIITLLIIINVIHSIYKILKKRVKT
ncbi:MAG: hypothetical protein ACYS6K_15260 [Planctomycetota bacterium]|jgi:hypothetical protein